MESVLIIREKDFNTKKELLSHISDELAFPEYFGNNLDALFDCLCDIEKTTVIAFDPIPAEESQAWFKSLYSVFIDAAAENEYIKVFVPAQREKDE